MFDDCDASFTKVAARFDVGLMDVYATVNGLEEACHDGKHLPLWISSALPDLPTPNDIVDVAAIHGHLETVRIIVRNRRQSRCSVSGLYGAIIHGHLHVVRYIYAHQPELARWPKAEDGADVLRRLLTPVITSMLEFYRRERGMILSVRDVEAFAFRGELAAVRAIRELDLVDWSAITADLMDTVASGGDYEMVKLLCEDRKSVPLCTTRAIDGAAENGHLSIVQLLHELQKPCTRLAVDMAAKNGHFQVVEFLLEHRNEGASPYGMQWASACGHLSIVQLMASKWAPCDVDNCVKAAKIHGHDNIVSFLEDYHGSRGSAGMNQTLSTTRRRHRHPNAR